MNRLTEDSVHFIRRCLFVGMTPTKISRKFHVQSHIVFDIVAGRTYQDIPVLPVTITPDDICATGRWDKIFSHLLHGRDQAAGVRDHTAVQIVDNLVGKRTWLKDYVMSIAGRSAELRMRKHPY